MTMDFINERVKPGKTEIWEIFNNYPMYHPLHSYTGHLQILDREGPPPPGHETSASWVSSLSSKTPTICSEARCHWLMVNQQPPLTFWQSPPHPYEKPHL